MFLYAITGDNPSAANWQRSLGYALDNPQMGSNTKGFDGEPVVLLSNRNLPADRLRIDEGQTWRRCGEAWVGFWNDLIPTEESLRKPMQLDGRQLELRGQQWKVPIAISFDETPDGQMFRQVHLSRYVDFTDEAE